MFLEKRVMGLLDTEVPTPYSNSGAARRRATDCSGPRDSKEAKRGKGFRVQGFKKMVH